ncbi:hypothetical protein [Aeoliella mucimassa]|nr:hypothetical protein [Aeoliella mucimassa]
MIHSNTWRTDESVLVDWLIGDMFFMVSPTCKSFATSTAMRYMAYQRSAN